MKNILILALAVLLTFGCGIAEKRDAFTEVCGEAVTLEAPHLNESEADFQCLVLEYYALSTLMTDFVARMYNEGVIESREDKNKYADQLQSALDVVEDAEDAGDSVKSRSDIGAQRRIIKGIKTFITGRD